MKCPNCGMYYAPPHRFCGRCGTPLEYEKKGSHWVPLLILLGMSLMGIALFLLFPSQTPAAPEPEFPWFEVNRGSVFFDEYCYDGDPQIEVPAVIAGRTITGIDDYGFAYCPGITTVLLPDTLTSIDDYAFTGCESLKAMELPDSLLTIGEGAFLDCPELEAIRIPASVQEIGPKAFDECEDLAYIFYGGTEAQWRALYPWSIDSRPMICTPDGNSFRSE